MPVQPRVVPIYWDAHFRSHPLDVTMFDEFLRTLFRSSWMTELGSQGVLPARLLPSFVPRTAPALRLGRLDPNEAVRDWNNSGNFRPVPHNTLLFHLIVAAAPGPRLVEAPLDPGCVMVTFTPAAARTLEVHSLAISRALAGAFLAAAGNAHAPPQQRVPLSLVRTA